jgi:hypothetical protein
MVAKTIKLMSLLGKSDQSPMALLVKDSVVHMSPFLILYRNRCTFDTCCYLQQIRRYDIADDGQGGSLEE